MKFNDFYDIVAPRVLKVLCNPAKGVPWQVSSVLGAALKGGPSYALLLPPVRSAVGVLQQMFIVDESMENVHIPALIGGIEGALQDKDHIPFEITVPVIGQFKGKIGANDIK